MQGDTISPAFHIVEPSNHFVFSIRLPPFTIHHPVYILKAYRQLAGLVQDGEQSSREAGESFLLHHTALATPFVDPADKHSCKRYLSLLTSSSSDH
jgi:hypothetical protein